MKRRFIWMLTCATVLLSTAAIAADSSMFLVKCGDCHKKGGEAAPVNPADKAGVVWSKYFKRGRHPVDLSGRMNPGEFDVVMQYLIDHAADSDRPEAAVIPK